MSAQPIVADRNQDGAGDNTFDIANDRLEGAEQIRDFIKPGMPMRTARRLLEDGIWPCWREGRQYVASKAALRAHWQQMTRGFSPKKRPAPSTPEAA
jgi:hypothetical protein